MKRLFSLVFIFLFLFLYPHSSNGGERRQHHPEGERKTATPPETKEETKQHHPTEEGEERSPTQWRRGRQHHATETGPSKGGEERQHPKKKKGRKATPPKRHHPTEDKGKVAPPRTPPKEGEGSSPTQTTQKGKGKKGSTQKWKNFGPGNAGLEGCTSFFLLKKMKNVKNQKCFSIFEMFLEFLGQCFPCFCCQIKRATHSLPAIQAPVLIVGTSTSCSASCVTRTAVRTGTSSSKILGNEITCSGTGRSVSKKRMTSSN